MHGSAKRGSGEAVRRDRKRERELVQLRTSDNAFDHAWRWAIQNVNGSDATDSVPDRIARGLDALAMGDFAMARGILVSLSDRDVAVEYADSWLGLVAGYFAATGDIGWARREWTRVRETLVRTRPSPVLLRALATTAESIGEVAHYRELVAAAAGPDPAPRDPIPHHDPQLDAAAVLRNVGSGGEPAWPPGSIASLVADLLGFEPDAARNRVRLRPVLPDHWARLEADNLRIGDGTLGLRYDRAAAEHSFRVLPQSGGIPFRVVFEPAVAGDRVRLVTIDGKTAQLDLRRTYDRWVCPVQFELDQERIVLVVTEGSPQ